jgi:hypothetical protein
MAEKNDKRTIFGWAMYDWANSAYITIFGAVVGAFFTGTIMLGDTYWGLSGEALFSILIGLGSIVLLLAMPVLGAVADFTDSKRHAQELRIRRRRLRPDHPLRASRPGAAVPHFRGGQPVRVRSRKRLLRRLPA